ncbi:MAG: cell division protein FtsQ/DivIB, partial [Planctomycetota bacterium]
MAKANSGKKKTTKAEDPVAVQVSPRKNRSLFFRPWTLVLSAVFGVTLLAFPIVARRLPSLQDRPEYMISAAEVTLSPPPRWIPANLTQQVFERAGLGSQESLHDPELSSRIAMAFSSHPWIDQVISVRKSFPARVHVDVVYREPVAMVRGMDGHYPVDRHGILLPGRDFSVADVAQYPVIERVSSIPMGKLGESWGDPAVMGAAELAAVLNEHRDEGTSWWKELQLSSILVPQRVALTEDIEE